MTERETEGGSRSVSPPRVAGITPGAPLNSAARPSAGPAPRGRITRCLGRLSLRTRCRGRNLNSCRCGLMCCLHISPPLLQQPRAFHGAPRSQMRSECTAEAREGEEGARLHSSAGSGSRGVPSHACLHALLFRACVHLPLSWWTATRFAFCPAFPPLPQPLRLYTSMAGSAPPLSLSLHSTALLLLPPFSLFCFADDAQTRVSATKRNHRKKGAVEQEGPAPRSGGEEKWEGALDALVFLLLM